MGHAYSVSDWGIKTERGEKDGEKEIEREKETKKKEKEKQRRKKKIERKKEGKKERKNRGTISMAQGLLGGFTSLKEAQQDQLRSNVT